MERPRAGICTWKRISTWSGVTVAAEPGAFSLRMVPLAEPPVVNVRLLSELVQVAFSQRRKLLRHTLGKWLDGRAFADDFDLQRRAEEVPVGEYVALALSV